MTSKNILSLLLVAALCLTFGASVGKRPAAFGRPTQLVPGVTLAKIVSDTGAVNPQRFRVERVDGEWLEIQVMKSKKTPRGEPYWIHVQEFGAFRVMGG